MRDQWLNTQTKVIVGLVIVVLAVGVVLPAFQLASNCGGNTAALCAVRNIHSVWMIGAHDRDTNEMAIADFKESELREYLGSIPGFRWIRESTIMVSTRKIALQSDKKEILAFCTAAYNNVPHRRFFKTPPRHAVVYSDGTSGLLLPSEMALIERIILSRFGFGRGNKASKGMQQL